MSETPRLGLPLLAAGQAQKHVTHNDALMRLDALVHLAVAADASLFNHAGTDHRLKLNKAGAARTASLLFQDNWSGRAEIGLAGDDQLRVKVSPNGTNWTEALVVDRTSGLVTLPASNWARETPQPNLLVNGDFQINQRAFAGGVLAAGAYGYDRWKAHTGGASLSRSGFDLTLTSGAIRQIVEPALWGVSSFASTPLCLSVENLSGGDLDVTIGSASGTITAGSGRRFVALTPVAGDTGNLTVQLAPAAGAVTFRAIKLEYGVAASSWLARCQTQERQLCERYHWRPGLSMLIDTFQAAACYFTSCLPFPTHMRITPTPGYSVTQEFNVTNGERLIAAASPAMGYARIRASAQGRVFATFEDIAFDAEL